MTDVDWVIFGIIAISALISLFRGFVKEAISLFLWLFAFGLAMAMSSRLAALLVDWISNPTLRQVAAFALLFFATILVGGLLGQLLHMLLKKAGLGLFDRLLGTVFGAVRGAVIVLVLLMLLPHAIAVDSQAWWRDSLLIPRFLVMEDWAIKVFSDVNAWRLDVMRDAAAVSAATTE